MGNAESDRRESQVYDIVKWIPGANIAYGVTRSIVYAGKGDDREAGLSIISATGAGAGLGVGLLGGPVGAVAGGCVGGAIADGLAIPIKDLPPKNW